MRIFAFLTIITFAIPASAETTDTIGSDRFFAVDPDAAIMQFEAARRCDLLGPLPKADEQNRRYDKNGARCWSELERIKFFTGGIQFGVMERLQTVGVPVEGMRTMLANPENLKRFQVDWAEPLHVLIVSMTADTDDVLIVTPDGDMAPYLKQYLRGFVKRRMSEAKPSDRAEVARIWGEIALEQFERYKERENVLPAFLLEEEPEPATSSD